MLYEKLSDVSVVAGLRLTILVRGSGTKISFPNSSLNTRGKDVTYSSEFDTNL